MKSSWSRIKYYKKISLILLWSFYNPELGSPHLPLLRVDYFIWNKKQRAIAWKCGGGGWGVKFKSLVSTDWLPFLQFLENDRFFRACHSYIWIKFLIELRSCSITAPFLFIKEISNHRFQVLEYNDFHNRMLHLGLFVNYRLHIWPVSVRASVRVTRDVEVDHPVTEV